MANKKILYTGTDGKIRELASGSGANIVNYNDTADLVTTKNVSFAQTISMCLFESFLK